tara:strand:+ start:1281 stop:1841 length:561 start_codon:yes stop_codon:yes gene_type:complete
MPLENVEDKTPSDLISHEILNSPESLSSWDSYILSRREAFVSERRTIIGREYDSNRRSWDSIINTEWMVMEERLNGGVGVEREMEAIMGIGFFQNHQFLLNEIKEITSHLETTEITIQNERKILTIYTFEDFLMLSNQGIFRESIFILDPQSRWKRKVSKLLTEYGYETVQSLMIEEERFYVISKK